MTAEDKLKNAIGLAMKAGKCKSGDFSVERMLKHGDIRLLILDSCVSDATRERYGHYAETHGVPLIFLDDIGTAIGKPSHKIAGITEDGFKNMILNAREASIQ